MHVRKTTRKPKPEDRSFTVLIEQDEDGFYVATVPALKSCYTQAKKLEDLYPRIREVIALCLEEEEPVPMRFIGVQQMRVGS
ncbi:MAG TPA: type II toxin-antitoxin system HicB family antitoxin [Blastocatellia bacterium]|jgi:predicted RNase H-like HicB family nuclease